MGFNGPDFSQVDNAILFLLNWFFRELEPTVSKLLKLMFKHTVNYIYNKWIQTNQYYCVSDFKKAKKKEITVFKMKNLKN